MVAGGSGPMVGAMVAGGSGPMVVPGGTKVARLLAVTGPAVETSFITLEQFPTLTPTTNKYKLNTMRSVTEVV